MSTKEQIEILLQEPLEVHKNGETVEVETLMLKAPTYRDRYDVLKLKQGFLGAVREATQSIAGDVNSTSQREKPKFKPEDVINFLLASNTLDFERYAGNLKNILCRDGCELAGGIKMTSLLFDKLSLKDFENILGSYVADFLLSTWL